MTVALAMLLPFTTPHPWLPEPPLRSPFPEQTIPWAVMNEWAGPLVPTSTVFTLWDPFESIFIQPPTPWLSGTVPHHNSYHPELSTECLSMRLGAEAGSTLL